MRIEESGIADHLPPACVGKLKAMLARLGELAEELALVKEESQVSPANKQRISDTAKKIIPEAMALRKTNSTLIDIAAQEKAEEDGDK